MHYARSSSSVALAILLASMLSLYPPAADAARRSTRAQGEVLEMTKDGLQVVEQPSRKARTQKRRKTASDKRAASGRAGQTSRTGAAAKTATGAAPGAAVSDAKSDATANQAARTLRILSLNAEHLMSEAIATQWQAWCGARHWQDREEDERPGGLPYCTALNGLDLRGRQLSAPVHSLPMLRRKQQQLRELLHQAKPDIVLLQEVTDSAAVAEMLGHGWTIHSTADHWHAKAISQHLAIAWRTGTLPHARIEVVEPLSRRRPDGHRTRPGLALHIQPRPGIELAMLNVHLKAGCRQGRMERQISRQPKRLWRRHAACAILQEQIPALEGWLDQQLAAGRHVMLAGDFNRDLRDEIKQGWPARADGSSAAAPVETPEQIEQISSVFAELNDETPPAARLMLLRTGHYRKHADCHRHIDNFIVNQALGLHLRSPLNQLQVEVIPFASPVSVDEPRPSDHCPHLLTLPWR